MAPTVTRQCGVRLCALAVLAAWLGLGCGGARAQTNPRNPHGVVLSIANAPTPADRDPGTPQLTWSPGRITPALVTLSIDGGKEMTIQFGTSGSGPSPYVEFGRTYVFRLYQLAPTRRLLAVLTVGRTISTVIVAQPANANVPLTPPFLNRFLQVFPFGALALLAVLAAQFGLRLRRAG